MLNKISTFFILLIPPIVFFLAGGVYCGVVSCELEALIYFILSPIIFIGELILLGIIILITKRRIKLYKTALITIGIVFVFMIFFTPEIPTSLGHITQNAYICMGHWECVQEIAEIKKDPSICDLIKGSENKNCKFFATDFNKFMSVEECVSKGFEESYCSFHVALDTKNSSLCEKADPPEECYGKLAIDTKDISLCQKTLSDDFWRNKCYEYFGKEFITVLSPNGGEVLKLGTNYEIRWKCADVLPATSYSARIYLLLNEQISSIIAGTLEYNKIIGCPIDGGKFLWKVGQVERGTISPGDKYKVRVDILDTVGQRNFISFDLSNNYFSVVE